MSSLFSKSRSRTISCCSCLYCDKYDISNEQDNQTNITTISDAVERDLRKETKPKCASKSICCLVSVLFLIFVSAGAILLYQSRKYFLYFNEQNVWLVKRGIVSRSSKIKKYLYLTKKNEYIYYITSMNTKHVFCAKSRIHAFRLGEYSMNVTIFMAVIE